MIPPVGHSVDNDYVVVNIRDPPERKNNYSLFQDRAD